MVEYMIGVVVGIIISSATWKIISSYYYSLWLLAAVAIAINVFIILAVGLLIGV